MARRDKKTGKFVSSVAEDTAEERDALLAAQKLDSIHKKVFDSLEKNNTALKEGGALSNILSGKTLENKLLTELQTKALKEKRLVSKEELDDIKDQVSNQKKLGGAINQILPGVVGFASGIEDAARGMSGLLGPAAMAVAIFVAIAKLALGYAKSITDTRKELGVSVATAAKLNAQNRILGLQAKLYGLEIEDVKNAQAAIRQDLGASVQEAANLSVSFARTSAATGQTSEDLAKTLSVMESISSSSREVLLNQIRTNAAMIEAAGVAPALVMKDIATNAEFFAQFAKDGGMNIINAGVAARKLGLEMSAVAGISESLLDFESSIEKQMEASMLLGRQINLDKARQLALSGDQEGVMKEILKAVGGEAEFNKMNVIQRKALAGSVGVNVEQLSRLVRNNTAGGTSAAIGAAAGGANPLLGPAQETVAQIRGLRKDMSSR
tara:strand:+ start:1290 stop:2606 length:1317 start_codon:yes stop_codon:yes gene_type:complete